MSDQKRDDDLKIIREPGFGTKQTVKCYACQGKGKRQWPIIDGLLFSFINDTCQVCGGLGELRRKL